MDKTVTLLINTKIAKIKRLKHITITFNQLKYYLNNKVYPNGFPESISTIANDINNINDDELITYLIKSNEQIKKDLTTTSEILQEGMNEEEY